MINKTEIRKIVNREMDSFLSPLGYKSRKEGGDIVATFEKKDGSNFYEFHCHTNKYDDYQLVYGFSFGINKIVGILKVIDSQVPLAKYKYQIKDSITAISPGQLLDPLHVSRAYKYFSTEPELLVIMEEVRSFYKDNFIPFCEKYSNVVELDKLINSPDNFWSDSVGKDIPISFFHVSRLIIAKLSNNPNYDDVVEKNFQALEEIWKKEGAVYDRSDESKPEVFASKYLKDMNT